MTTRSATVGRFPEGPLSAGVRGPHDGPRPDLVIQAATVAVLVLTIGALTALTVVYPAPPTGSVATMAITTTAAPTTPPARVEQDPVAAEACRRLAANGDTSDLALMLDIGSSAAQSLDNSIRTAGQLLHDLAQIAATNRAHGAAPRQQTKDLTAVTGALTDLLNACNRNVFRLA
jgi:hypothetical protein